MRGMYFFCLLSDNCRRGHLQTSDLRPHPQCIGYIHHSLEFSTNYWPTDRRCMEDWDQVCKVVKVNRRERGSL